MKLSPTVTSWPSSSSIGTRTDPTYPAPPVTRIFNSELRSLGVRLVAPKSIPLSLEAGLQSSREVSSKRSCLLLRQLPEGFNRLAGTRPFLGGVVLLLIVE